MLDIPVIMTQVSPRLLPDVRDSGRLGTCHLRLEDPARNDLLEPAAPVG